jgi:hypothetical protein
LATADPIMALDGRGTRGRNCIIVHAFVPAKQEKKTEQKNKKNFYQNA